MAAEAKQKITEYEADLLRPRMVWDGEDEVFDGAIQVQCPEAGDVAFHVIRDSAEAPISSIYMTPAEAYVLAERIRTAAWIAEQLGAPDA